MDFYNISERAIKGGVEIYPDFIIKRSNDIMIRGGRFYAIWDQEKGAWSRDEDDVRRLVDEELAKYKVKREETCEYPLKVRWMYSNSSKSWYTYRHYILEMFDNYHELDLKVTFQNSEVKKTDYRSKRLKYPIEAGGFPAYDKLISTLYSPEERAKIEWTIGGVIAGDSDKIQKFLVFYGSAGTGKSTILNIVQMLFEGYYTIFDAKSLSSSSDQFSTTFLKDTPLVAIQHDGDLSKIEDNTRINSIVSHEEIPVKEKYKSEYISRPVCILMMGTNRPVKITDAKSGVIRRLIDVTPTGNRVPAGEYQNLMSQIKFELGSIANHCLETYKKMGIHYYDEYIPTEMMFKTDLFYNFVEENYLIFRKQDSTTLTQAYAMYKDYMGESGLNYIMPRHAFREELKNYFKSFELMGTKSDGSRVRSLYTGFLTDKFNSVMQEVNEVKSDVEPLELSCESSLLDAILAEQPAQYASSDGKPLRPWNQVKTKLKDLDTRKLHYVKLPKNHIVIDFDLRGDDGEKDAQKCLCEATKWPLTYAEFSQGGKGLHLHYYWENEPEKLSRLYSDGIEIKVFTGNSSLRRRLSKCNDVPIATISSGLPLKEAKVINFEAVKTERALRALIEKNLRKEVHNATKPSIDFIFKILKDAYESGLKYDVSDLQQAVIVFANNSTHNASYCLERVAKMKFRSDEPSSNVSESEGELVFFDTEVFPNLFLVNWKIAGSDDVIRMINPTPDQIEELFKKKLVGFNNRRYDNHMLYGCYIGYDNKALYALSQRIVSGDRNAFFGEAYNISYTDVLDFSSEKKSLKKFEIELGIHHQELGLPWDEPVPEEKWEEVAAYCDNDVRATEAVFNARRADWVAREILADLSGLTVNDTTQQHAAKIIFGNDSKPQKKFVYPDLSKEFPGYKFEFGKSFYRDEDPKEGGYVYTEPGLYINVALLDIASMHPTTIRVLNLFGPYTKNFTDIVDARLMIKHGHPAEDFKDLLDGKLVRYIASGDYDMKDLAYAMKIIINIVYGLTSASFDNKFKDPRNVDNVVAKRGSLFMIDLKHAVQEKGFTVAHIKTDSIKIPNATPEIIEFVKEFGQKYGYTFEHEANYSKMCLINKAEFIAKFSEEELNGDQAGKWYPKGDRFLDPYVFKTLFSGEPVSFEDFCQTKNVKVGAMYLDRNEAMPEGEHFYQFVGRTGLFCPVVDGVGGGLLVCKRADKYSNVQGTTGYRWLEAEVVKELGLQDAIDMNYYRKMIDDVVDEISKYGDVETFLYSEDVNIPF